MKPVAKGLLISSLFTMCMFAQCAPPAAKAAPADTSAAKPQDVPTTATDSSKPAGDQNQATDKKDKKKKKDKKGTQDDLTATVFSEAAAQDVLGMLRDGLEGHSQRLMLSAFDDNKMDGYLAFEDQLEAFFNKYEGFTVHFRIAQTTTEGAKGVVLADIEMEQIPRGGAAPPMRKQTQMRFELERGSKGWRIVDFRPRGFFT